MADRYRLGDIVEFRKPHPCGSKEWEVMRTGADFRVRCLGCGHQVMMPRPRFEKSVKKIVETFFIGRHVFRHAGRDMTKKPDEPVSCRFCLSARISYSL